MKTANMTRNKGQVFSVGNYLMTGKVLGKGHFARVEEATHRIIGRKVAIKIIDLTCIKEEYARRNLHREPRVMAKLRHPCIAALYETMMITEEDYVCEACRDLAMHAVNQSLQQVSGSGDELAGPSNRGHTHVCLLCGCSLLHRQSNSILRENPTELQRSMIAIIESRLAPRQHGPRLYVVMEAAGGGDLCTHVLGARGLQRGLPEARARSLAAQLVSAVRHMHARGVVHRDLKMENIMLDSTKQFIKIVDFGLSNLWSAGASLRTPCGSLEYAAPELFVDGRRYGPEVDLWSIGVIVYGMVTGGLPFTGGTGGAAEAEGRSRPLLRAAITRGFTRKQRAALAAHSAECKAFIQHLLEPNVELRMKIDEAARHRWIKKPGMRMKTHPFGLMENTTNRDTYRQISELCQMSVMDVVAQIKAEPFGAIAGVYNIKTHLLQLQSVSGADLLWSSNNQEQRPISPPEYRPTYDTDSDASTSKAPTTAPMKYTPLPQKIRISNTTPPPKVTVVNRTTPEPPKPSPKIAVTDRTKCPLQSPRSVSRPLSSMYILKKPVYKVYENGDCRLDPRLPSIDEHSSADVTNKLTRSKNIRIPFVRKVSLEEERPVRLNSCPNKVGDKRAEFYRKGGDGIPSWRASGGLVTPPTRILLQSTATTIKRASLGNITSPHSSSNSQCKSERAMPVGWYSTRSIGKETTHLQRLRRTAPMK